MVRITLTRANPAREWWEAAEEDEDAPDFWPALSAVLKERGEVSISEEDAAYLLLWAQSLPGWESGPPRARLPFTFSQEND